jgi:hypothetical protein
MALFTALPAPLLYLRRPDFFLAGMITSMLSEKHGRSTKLRRHWAPQSSDMQTSYFVATCPKRVRLP